MRRWPGGRAAEVERAGRRAPEAVRLDVDHPGFAAELDRLADHVGDQIGSVGSGTEVVMLIRELEERGFVGALMTTSALASVSAIDSLGDAAEGGMLTRARFESDDSEYILPAVSQMRGF